MGLVKMISALVVACDSRAASPCLTTGVRYLYNDTTLTYCKQAKYFRLIIIFYDDIFGITSYLGVPLPTWKITLRALLAI